MSKTSKQQYLNSKHSLLKAAHESLSEDNIQVAAAATAAAATIEAINDLEHPLGDFDHFVEKDLNKATSARLAKKALHEIALKKASLSLTHDNTLFHERSHLHNEGTIRHVIGHPKQNHVEARLHQQKQHIVKHHDYVKPHDESSSRKPSATESNGIIENKSSITEAGTASSLQLESDTTPKAKGELTHGHHFANGSLDTLPTPNPSTLLQDERTANAANAYQQIGASGASPASKLISYEPYEASELGTAAASVVTDATAATAATDATAVTAAAVDDAGAAEDAGAAGEDAALVAADTAKLMADAVASGAVRATAAVPITAAAADAVAASVASVVSATDAARMSGDAMHDAAVQAAEQAAAQAALSDDIGFSGNAYFAMDNAEVRTAKARALKEAQKAKERRDSSLNDAKQQQSHKHRRHKVSQATAPLVRFLGHWLYSREEGLMLDKSAASILGCNNYHDWYSTSDFLSNFLPSEQTRLFYNFTTTLMGDIIFERCTFVKGPCAGHTFVVQGSVLERNENGEAIYANGFLSHESSPYSEFLTRELSGDGMFFWNACTDEVISSASYHKMLGYTEFEFPHTYTDFVENLVHPDDNDILLVQEHIVRTPYYGNYFESCLRLKHKDGHYIWTIARGLVIERNEDGIATQILGSQTDINIVQENFDNIKFMMFTDSLTGLHNRTYFQQNALRFSAPEQCPVSIIFVDVSGLKLTNDILGHSYGDYLLIKTSEIIREAINNYRIHTKHEKEYLEMGQRNYQDRHVRPDRSNFYMTSLSGNSRMPFMPNTKHDAATLAKDLELDLKLEEASHIKAKSNDDKVLPQEFIAAGATMAFRNKDSDFKNHIHLGGITYVNDGPQYLKSAGTITQSGSIESIDHDLVMKNSLKGSILPSLNDTISHALLNSDKNLPRDQVIVSTLDNTKEYSAQSALTFDNKSCLITDVNGTKLNEENVKRETLKEAAQTVSNLYANGRLENALESTISPVTGNPSVQNSAQIAATAFAAGTKSNGLIITNDNDSSQHIEKKTKERFERESTTTDSMRRHLVAAATVTDDLNDAIRHVRSQNTQGYLNADGSAMIAAQEAAADAAFALTQAALAPTDSMSQSFVGLTDSLNSSYEDETAAAAGAAADASTAAAAAAEAATSASDANNTEHHTLNHELHARHAPHDNNHAKAQFISHKLYTLQHAHAAHAHATHAQLAQAHAARDCVNHAQVIHGQPVHTEATQANVAHANAVHAQLSLSNASHNHVMQSHAAYAHHRPDRLHLSYEHHHVDDNFKRHHLLSGRELSSLHQARLMDGAHNAPHMVGSALHHAPLHSFKELSASNFAAREHHVVHGMPHVENHDHLSHAHILYSVNLAADHHQSEPNQATSTKIKPALNKDASMLGFDDSLSVTPHSSYEIKLDNELNSTLRIGKENSFPFKHQTNLSTEFNASEHTQKQSHTAHNKLDLTSLRRKARVHMAHKGNVEKPISDKKSSKYISKSALLNTPAFHSNTTKSLAFSGDPSLMDLGNVYSSHENHDGAYTSGNNKAVGSTSKHQKGSTSVNRAPNTSAHTSHGDELYSYNQQNDKTAILAQVFHDSTRNNKSNVIEALQKIGSPFNPQGFMAHGVRAQVVRAVDETNTHNADFANPYAKTLITKHNPLRRKRINSTPVVGITIEKDLKFYHNEHHMPHFNHTNDGFSEHSELDHANAHKPALTASHAADTKSVLCAAASLFTNTGTHQSDSAHLAANAQASATGNAAHEAHAAHAAASAASSASDVSSASAASVAGVKTQQATEQAARAHEATHHDHTPNTGYGDELCCDANIMAAPELSRIFELDHTYCLRTQRCDLSFNKTHHDIKMINDCESIQEEKAIESGLYEKIIKNEERAETFYENSFEQSFIRKEALISSYQTKLADANDKDHPFNPHDSYKLENLNHPEEIEETPYFSKAKPQEVAAAAMAVANAAQAFATTHENHTNHTKEVLNKRKAPQANVSSLSESADIIAEHSTEPIAEHSAEPIAKPHAKLSAAPSAEQATLPEEELTKIDPTNIAAVNRMSEVIANAAEMHQNIDPQASLIIARANDLQKLDDEFAPEGRTTLLESDNSHGEALESSALRQPIPAYAKTDSHLSNTSDVMTNLTTHAPEIASNVLPESAADDTAANAAVHASETVADRTSDQASSNESGNVSFAKDHREAALEIHEHVLHTKTSDSGDQEEATAASYAKDKANAHSSELTQATTASAIPSNKDGDKGQTNKVNQKADATVASANESDATIELLRLAGDEFLVILPHCTEAEATAICKAIDYTRNTHNVWHEQNTPIADRPVPIFFGIGHATFNPKNGEQLTLKDTVDLADSRMQKNKNARRAFDYKCLKRFFEEKKGREVSMRDDRRFVVLDDSDRNEIRKHRLSNIIF